MAKITKTITEPPTRSVMTKNPENFGALGKQIKIGAKSNISVNKPGYKCEWFVPTVEVLIGIGKDHTAHLLMDTDAWKALKKGSKIHITTVQEFKEKFL